MSCSIAPVLERAFAKRESLVAEDRSNAMRLFHGDADGIPGLVIERFAEVLIVQFHEGRLTVGEEAVRSAIEDLRDRMGFRVAYRKVFVRDRGHVASDLADAHGDPRPWLGEAAVTETIVREDDLRFIVRPHEGFAVGLFLEHRENRERIRGLASGRRVLNTFSYTGAFSVAAAKGGAASVHSVDLSKRYLEWSKQNFAANGIDLAAHMFFCSDVFEFYRRAARQKRRYDLIILDPPTFSRLRRPDRTFVLADELDSLVAGAMALLDPGGVIVLATNDRQLAVARLDDAIRSGAGSRRCGILNHPDLPVDFAGDPDFSKSVIAHVE